MNWLERHQLRLYLAAMALGAALSLTGSPALPVVAEALSPYVLAVLLLANFMGIPLAGDVSGGGASRDAPRAKARIWHKALGPLGVRVLLVAALVTPVLTGVLIAVAFPGGGGPVALAVAIVLLAPCVDYVVVFAGFAGGNAAALLRLTPLMLLLQLITIPLWISIYVNIGILSYDAFITHLPLESWVALAPLAVPLALAWLLHHAGNRSPALARIRQAAERASERFMVPIMCLMLGTLCTAYTRRVLEHPGHLAPLVTVYLAYGILAGILARILAAIPARGAEGGPGAPLGSADRIALIFSAVTRNALIVLPVVAAASTAYGVEQSEEATLMGTAVLTQTLVELLIMVALIRLLRPRRGA